MEVWSTGAGVLKPQFGFKTVMFVNGMSRFVLWHLQCGSLNISCTYTSLTHSTLAPLVWASPTTVFYSFGFSLFTKCNFSTFHAPIFSWSAFVGYANQNLSTKYANKPVQNTWQVYTELCYGWKLFMRYAYFSNKFERFCWIFAINFPAMIPNWWFAIRTPSA